jgi:hypothetical protein
VPGPAFAKVVGVAGLFIRPKAKSLDFVGHAIPQDGVDDGIHL